MKRGKSLTLTFVLAVGLTSACTTAPMRVGGKSAEYWNNGVEVRSVLMRHFENWEGVPHRYGGTDRSGIDCSGFVQLAYRDLFNVNLPRSARDMSRIGESVGLDELRVGDLMFFRGAFSPNHVGIYLGDGTFLHVSSSKGVTRTRVDDSYWRKYISSARRVLG